MAVSSDWLPSFPFSPHFPFLVRLTVGSLQASVHHPYRPPEKSDQFGRNEWVVTWINQTSIDDLAPQIQGDAPNVMTPVSPLVSISWI